MHSAHLLNATDLDEVTQHRHLLTYQQRVELGTIHYRLEAYPQRFARGLRYAQTAGLVLLSDWPSRRRFCYCSIRKGLCGLWKLCDHCSYRKRTLLRQRFLTQFSRSRWWFLTISFDGVLPFEGHFAEDMGLYWDACHEAVRSMVRDGSFLGAVKVEELHVQSLLPLKVLPHCHFLIAADDVTVGQIEDLRQLVLAHRGTQPDWGTGEMARDEAERVDLEVSTKTYLLPTEGDFSRVMGYLIKPMNLVTPYLNAWPEASLNGREGVPDLNANVVEFFDGYVENCYSRHQLDYMGILDARTRSRCIAVPKAMRVQPAHKARVNALLREFADEATDGPVFDRVAIETLPLAPVAAVA